MKTFRESCFELIILNRCIQPVMVCFEREPRIIEKPEIKFDHLFMNWRRLTKGKREKLINVPVVESMKIFDIIT